MPEPWKIAAFVALVGIHLGGIVIAIAFGLKRRTHFVAWQDIAALATPPLLAIAVVHATRFIDYRAQVAQALRYGETFVELRPSGEELWAGPSGSSLIDRWSITKPPAPGPVDAIVVPICVALWAIARIRSRSAASPPPA